MELDAEKLILLVGLRPAIFDYSMKEHRNQTITDMLWEEIANEMNASVAECKSKWNILRNSYARYLRESRKSSPSVSGICKRKKWYLADSMAFLQNFIGHHKKIGNFSSGLDEDEQTGSLTPDEESSAEIFKTERTPHFMNTFGPEKHNLTPSDMVTTSMMDISRQVSLNDERKEQDNTQLLFFKSIIPDVEKLTAKNQRKFKIKVMSLLNDLLDEQEDASSRLQPSPAYLEQNMQIPSPREEKYSRILLNE
ncbi:uncharacterized protein [Anabrus simplex]|uniref:uncharacterized protein n=1 Tax=Anabrus simplex TaxID=316456 RepID=UPI0035A33328